MSKDKKKLILKNETTGEIRPMVRCGMSACNRVIHLGESISYNSNMMFIVMIAKMIVDLFKGRLLMMIGLVEIVVGKKLRGRKNNVGI